MRSLNSQRQENSRLFENFIRLREQNACSREERGLIFRTAAGNRA